MDLDCNFNMYIFSPPEKLLLLKGVVGTTIDP